MDVIANSSCYTSINKAVNVHMTPQVYFDDIAFKRCVTLVEEKNSLVYTIPCSMCLCTVYFTGYEMSTVVHINLQNNRGKYSLTI